MTLRNPTCPTPMQAEVLVKIREHLAERGIPPTQRELADALGHSSSFSVRKHLQELRLKGYIMLDPSLSRSIRLTEQGREYATV